MNTRNDGGRPIRTGYRAHDMLLGSYLEISTNPAKRRHERRGKRTGGLCCARERERERERECVCVCVNEYATRILFTPTPSLKEKRRKRPFEDKRRMMMTIEKIRIHMIIINLPQPLLRALRQSRTRSSRVRYSHRRRRSSSCHFLEQQQPRQKREGKD